MVSIGNVLFQVGEQRTAVENYYYAVSNGSRLWRQFFGGGGKVLGDNGDINSDGVTMIESMLTGVNIDGFAVENENSFSSLARWQRLIFFALKFPSLKFLFPSQSPSSPTASPATLRSLSISFFPHSSSICLCTPSFSASSFSLLFRLRPCLRLCFRLWPVSTVASSFLLSSPSSLPSPFSLLTAFSLPLAINRHRATVVSVVPFRHLSLNKLRNFSLLSVFSFNINYKIA